MQVLDGLGKSLDKKFDISEISRPYARELMQEGSSRSASVTASVVKRATRQSRAVVNLFKVRGGRGATSGTRGLTGSVCFVYERDVHLNLPQHASR